MPKRKAIEADAGAKNTGLRRSTRRKSSGPDNATTQENPTKAPPKAEKKTSTAREKGGKEENVTTERKTPKAKATTFEASIPPKEADDINTPEKTYWLLKAEPETRLENGTDVKFSIDDLASRTEPEPWDGIRNYVARNNLRAMKKGDLAFFYHSNCKEPGIVGIMEIVREHSPDLSAHDPKAPYYDASSKVSDPKWSVVHVEFRGKFTQQIGLKELREMGKPGSPLQNMQMLKQSRLSVSKVTAAEWKYLLGVVEERGGFSKET
ncbi:PUA-like domain-containing protein [Pseudomassariella vexata]|uniref:Thymocyte nuclear protein 1 n=1 Tax=Pseudomassariella vexata TaxID=1141098 RepID=A0A1Y2E6G4_9PEZI|nr:PUA-like domain-containing protein [Pseudomassariella vexata]ORY67141.1 PUA-like domain-containing protein [Pseudomassariella vexata]